MGLHHGGVPLSNVAATHHRKSHRSVHAAKVADYLRKMRVVSLVPSWTEFLHDLGVDVVGQTKFCVRPEAAFRRVSRVGGTKTVDPEKVLALNPDLVVANREENDRAQVEAVREALPAGAEVLVTDVRTVASALHEMAVLGGVVEREALAQEWVSRIHNAWGAPRTEVGRAGYAVWSSPWMVAGRDTFIHDVMRHWGIGNAFANSDSAARYPTLAPDPETGAAQADLWLLPSEPFPFTPKHVESLSGSLPEAKFQLVDGEAFSWYGSRMLHATDHLSRVSEWVGHAVSL